MDATVNMKANDYQVDLSVFQGPLDLLLYLIKKEEVEIYEISIAKITKQYLHYIELMTELNLEVAGEFILMAATLIRIKTKLLLPRDPESPEENDPREELIAALLEYKKYKEAGDVLRERAIEEEQYYIPPSPVEKIKGRVDLQPVTTLFDLMSAFKDVLIAKKEEALHEVEVESISIEDRMKTVLKFLKEREFATFPDLFADVPKKIVAVVTFIAILELARSRRIAVFQSVPFAEVRVYRGDMFDAANQDVDLIDVEEID